LIKIIKFFNFALSFFVLYTYHRKLLISTKELINLTAAIFALFIRYLFLGNISKGVRNFLKYFVSNKEINYADEGYVIKSTSESHTQPSNTFIGLDSLSYICFTELYIKQLN